MEWATHSSKQDVSSDATREACIDFILTDAAFYTVQLSNIPRAIISCYMNLLFAQTIKEANEQFIVVFGPSQRVVTLALKEKEFEMYQRA